MKKILLFIATEKGYSTLYNAVNKGFLGSIGCVITFKEDNVELSYHEKIKQICEKNNIQFYMWNEIKDNLLDCIKEHKITGAIAIAWRFLLPLKINDMLEDKLIVFHDSLLPKYRGFAPTPTAIICGESIIGITALFATEKVDQGEIILQKKINIEETEYIKDIIEKQSKLCEEAFIEILDKMNTGKIMSIPQNELEATYSIWRSPEDCEINWNLTSKEIYNFIRAVASPYPGAFTYLEGRKIIITRALVVEDLNFVQRHCGKIWSINNNEPNIVCGSGMLKIVSAKYENGEKVVFKKVRVRLK